jgi:hypothetical protein
MNRRSSALILSFTALAIALAGCGKATHTGALSIYTRARSAAKGPWSDVVIVVNGYGFTPHKRIDLKFTNLPADKAAMHNSWHTNSCWAPTTNADGSFSYSMTVKSQTTPIASWSRSIVAFPPLDYYADPNSEVTVTAKEHWGSNVVMANIKAGELIDAPYSGAPADTAKAAAAPAPAPATPVAPAKEPAKAKAPAKAPAHKK